MRVVRALLDPNFAIRGAGGRALRFEGLNALHADPGGEAQEREQQDADSQQAAGAKPRSKLKPYEIGDHAKVSSSAAMWAR